MDLKRLRYFARIAQDGSLTKAAGVLGIAQPALSRQMRVLEQELGAALFRRTPRGMSLTEAGDNLLASIAGPLRDIDLATRNFRTSGDRIEGDFTIGLPPGISQAFGRRFITSTKRDSPEIRLRVVEGNTGSLQEWLIRAVIDFALLEEPSPDPRLAHHCVLEETLMLIQQRSEADAAALGFERASELPLILPSHHLGARKAINIAAAARGVILTTAIEVDDPRLALQLVIDGLGDALLPPCLADLAGEDMLLSRRALIEPEVPYRLYLSFRDQPRFRQGRAERRVADLLTAAVGHERGNPIA